MSETRGDGCQHDGELSVYLVEKKHDMYVVMEGEIVDYDEDKEPEPSQECTVYCTTCGQTWHYMTPDEAPVWIQHLYQKVKAWAYSQER